MSARAVFRAVVAIALSLATRARAADANVYVSGPILLGADQHVTVDSTTSFVIGFRPEAIVAFGSRSGRALGIGAYGDATKAGGQSWLGGGVTAVGYNGAFGVALSGGVDERFANGTSRLVPVVGAFLGLRLREDGLPLDLPFGARVDLRLGSSDVPTSIAFQLQLDILGAIGFFVNLAIHPSYGH